jgi:hypothetical protein
MDTWSTFKKVKMLGIRARQMGCVDTPGGQWAEQQTLSGRRTIAEDRVQVPHYALFSMRVPAICRCIFVYWAAEMKAAERPSLEACRTSTLRRVGGIRLHS